MVASRNVARRRLGRSDIRYEMREVSQKSQRKSNS